jgi:hypothetical protein
VNTRCNGLPVIVLEGGEEKAHGVALLTDAGVTTHRQNVVGSLLIEAVEPEKRPECDLSQGAVSVDAVLSSIGARTLDKLAGLLAGLERDVGVLLLLALAKDGDCVGIATMTEVEHVRLGGGDGKPPNKHLERKARLRIFQKSSREQRLTAPNQKETKYIYLDYSQSKNSTNESFKEDWKCILE